MKPVSTTGELPDAQEAELRVVERYLPRVRERYLKHRGLDEAFAQAWLRYASRIFGREVLDPRTRILVMVGQFSMSRRPEQLREAIEAALSEGLDLREVLEVIFQTAIYGGNPTADQAIDAFIEVVGGAGRLEEVRSRGLRVGQRGKERDFEAERSQWHPADAADPRAEELSARYGLGGISIALLLRPLHTLDNATFLGSLDADYTQAFYDFGYDDMYGRQVLDHKTRLLCMVGNTLAIGEIVQTKHHMRTALRQGATPREVLEVLIQSIPNVGHPNIVPERFKDLAAIVADEGLTF
jgi:alkylhydroperoxidase/carboxymuconolactone decarboxylase family protein YurZ